MGVKKVMQHIQSTSLSDFKSVLEPKNNKALTMIGFQLKLRTALNMIYILNGPVTSFTHLKKHFAIHSIHYE